jgi:hypothetical protein
MVNEYIEVQDYVEVQQIDNRREIQNVVNNQIVEQTNNIENINNHLESISNALDSTSIGGNVDLTEVTEKIDEIDTTIITAQTGDILLTVQEQQEQIEVLKEQNNTLESKLDLILSKLEEM